MEITETYVTRLNGMTGGNYPQNLSNDVVIDAGYIRESGSSGSTIPQQIQGLASSMRPLILEKIGTDDYIMKLGAGIPYEPTT